MRVLSLWLTVLICSFLYTYCGATPTVCDGDENADPEFDCMAFPPDDLNSEVGDNVGDYTISWGEVAGAQKYEFVEYCSRSVVLEAEIPWASGKVEVMPKGSTRKSVINKETGLYCWYRTRSCNTHGCGRYSKIFSFVVGAYPPSSVAVSFPFNIGDADYSGAYQLTWDEPSQGSDKVTGYEWRESSDGGNTWGNGNFIAASSSRELDFSTQEFGKTYRYQMRSCHPSPFPGEPKVCGPWSDPEEISVNVPTPSGLSTPGGTSYTGTYSVSWSSLGSGMSGIVDYQLSENDGASIPINGGGTVSSYSISGQAFQQTYSYSIRACVNPSSNRGQACSPWSSASAPVAVRLQVPSGLAMSDTGGAGDSGVTNTSYDGEYQLSWSASVAGATRYEIREKAGSQPWSSVSSCTNTPCIITGKSAGSTTYKYAVRACLGASGNEANCGDWTASGNVVSVSVPVLSSPSINRGGDGSSGTSNSGDYTISRGDATGAASYKLQTRSKAKSATWTTWAPSDATNITNFSSSSQSFTSQDYGRDYQYRAQACAGSNCSPWSTPTAVAVRLDTLTSISMSDAGGVNDASVSGTSYDGTYQLSWSANITGADRYEWKESSDGGSNWSSSTDASCTDSTCSVDFADKTSSSTAYRYQVRACSTRGNACGNWFSLNVSVPELSAPGNVAIYDTAVGGDAISTSNGAYDVRWNAVSNAIRYEIEQKIDSGNWQSFASLSIDGATGQRRVTPVAADYQKSYSYQIRACTGVNCSDWQETSGSVALRFSPPQNLEMSDANGVGDSGVTNTSYDGEYQLSWDSVADVSRYEVRETDGDGNNTIICNTTTVLTCDISGKAADTSYSYEVRACLSASGDENCGDWTATTEVRIPVLGAPTLSRGGDGASGTSNSGDYTIIRDTVTGTVSYKLQARSKAQSAIWTTWTPSDVTGITNFSSSPQSFSSQDYGQDYQYRAQACAGTNCSPWSSTTEVAVRLQAPTGITMSDTAGVNDSGSTTTSYDGTYTLSWSLDSVTGADRYEWQETSTDTEGTATCVASNCSVDFTDKAISSTDYSYQVRACSDRGSVCSDWSSSINVSVSRLPNPGNFAIYDTGGDSISFSYGPYDLKWDTVSNATSYEIEQEIDGSGSWQSISGVSTSGQKRITPSTSSDYQKSYSYRIRPCSGVNCGNWLETSASVALRFAPPQNLVRSDSLGSGENTATSYDGDYQLSWGSVAGASRYEVRERTADDQPWSSVSCTNTPCDISGKAVGTSYSYGVRACLSASGDANCGDWTTNENLVSVTVSGLDAPTAPEFASGVTTAVSHSAAYRLSWSSVIGAAAYRLQESKDSGSWTTITTQTNTQYEVSGRDYGHSYTYRVQTCASFDGTNGNNCGDWSSSSASVGITLPHPGNVTIPTNPIYSSSNYTVSWTQPPSSVIGSGSYQIPASEISYQLEESTDAGFSNVTETRMVSGNPNCRYVGGTGFECSFNSASRSGRTYYYRVKLLRSGVISSSSWTSSDSGVAVSWWPILNLALNESVDVDGSYVLSWINPGFSYSLILQEKITGNLHQSDGSTTTSVGEWTEVADVAATSLNYSLRNKTGHATYAYRSRLCRNDDTSVCNGVWSAQSEVSLSVVLPEPTALTIPNANNFTYGGDYTVAWYHGGAYSIDARTYAFKETLPGANPTVTFESNLSVDPPTRYASGTYSYAVAACTSIGCTPYTASTSLVIQDLSVPPTLSTSDGDREYYSGQYQLNWTQEFVNTYAGSRRYQLQDGDGNDIILSSSEAVSHSIGPPPLASGSYSYKVRACASTDTSKCSPWSSTLNITVRDLDLSGLSLSSDDGYVSHDGIYTISWNGVTEATSYVLLEDGIESCTPSGDTTSCLLSGKSDGSSFEYKVKACAGSRCFVSSDAYTVAVNFQIEINDCVGLDNIRNNLSGKYKLVADISNASCLNEPIGTQATPFTGNFNGSGHTISNLTINIPSTNYVGLFGYVGSGAKIMNIGLRDANISGNSYVSGLVGYNHGGDIINSYVTGIMRGGGDFISGLVGVNRGNISNSYVTGTVTGMSNFVGGIAGVNYGTIVNSYMTDTVTGQGTVGGLVGSNGGGSISNSYAAKVVTGQSSVGGFVGSNSGTISGTNYFVDSDGGSDGVSTGSCSSGCTRKTFSQLAQATSASGWTSSNWDFGTTSQLPALKYTNDSDTSEIECGGDTGVNCGQLLSGQPVSLSAQTISCEGRGGVTHIAPGGQEICEIAGASCPSGWQRASNWSTTTARTCSDSTSCTTGSHAFGETSPETSPETCSYRDRYTAQCRTGKDASFTSSCTRYRNATCSATTTHVGCTLNNTCEGVGGVTYTIPGGQEICKIPSSSCPSGWQYLNWSTTTARTCSDNTSCTTGSHAFGETSPETSPETCSYRDRYTAQCRTGKDASFTSSCTRYRNATCSATTTHIGCALNNTCAGIGGVIVTSGDQEICKIAGTSCPSGWQYLNWSTTTARTCSDNTSCTTGSHAFGETSPETSPETCSYRDRYTAQCRTGKDASFTSSCTRYRNATCSATTTHVGCGRNW